MPNGGLDAVLDLQQLRKAVPWRLLRDHLHQIGADVLAEDVLGDLEAAADVFRQVQPVHQIEVRQQQEHALLEFHQVVGGDVDELADGAGALYMLLQFLHLRGNIVLLKVVYIHLEVVEPAFRHHLVRSVVVVEILDLHGV